MGLRPLFVILGFSAAIIAQDAPPKPPSTLVDSITVEVSPTINAREAVKLDPSLLAKEMEQLCARAGIKVLNAEAVKKFPQAFHVKFLPQTLRTTDGLCCYEVAVRMSREADIKVQDNEPGKPQKVWYAGYTAARRQPDGMDNDIRRTMQELLLQMVQSVQEGQILDSQKPMLAYIAPLTAPFGKEISRATEVNFKQVKIKSRPERPHYPDPTMDLGEKGRVVCEVTLDPKGEILKAVAKSGPPSLYFRAFQNVFKHELEPPLIFGQAAFVRFTLFINFRPQEDQGLRLKPRRP